VAALKRNQWQHSTGIGGSFGTEYAEVQTATPDAIQVPDPYNIYVI
jgi:hypothetical protein